MRLDPDCVRDVLLAVEACPFTETLTTEKLSIQLPVYPEELLWYTCLKLSEGGYLTLVTMDIMRSYRPGIKCIVDLTYQGHEFLDSIRDTERYKTVKKVAESARNFSLAAIKEISEGISSAAITAALQGRG